MRMADNGWPNTITRTKQHKEIVRPAIEHFFELLEWNYKPDIIRIESWDCNRPDYRGAERFPWGFRPAQDFCVGDEVHRIVSEWNPYIWSGPEWSYRKWDEQWGDRVRCCLRAGLDMAAEPSAGVVGFCKEDINRMYPDGVPKWIREPWEQKNGSWHPVLWEDIEENERLWL